MGKLKETQEAYFGQEEKVIVERDRMSLSHALTILHGLRDGFQSCGEVYEAFSVVFEWVDNMVLFFYKFGDTSKNESAAIPDSMADSAGADQDDRSDT